MSPGLIWESANLTERREVVQQHSTKFLESSRRFGLLLLRSRIGRRVMRELILPKLDEEQSYKVAEILFAQGGIEWSVARQRADETPGAVYWTDDEDNFLRIVGAFQGIGLNPEVRTRPAKSPLQIRNDVTESHTARSPQQYDHRDFWLTISAWIALFALLSLLSWTETAAGVQETGPQILQVYTRSAFYGIVIIGLLFGVYALRRK